MASKMLGRCACPECGFNSAHVKITEAKETARAYRYCPECGAQYFPRSNRQEKDLLDKTRKEAQEAIKTKIEPEVSQEPEKTPVVPEIKPEKAFRIVFGAKVPV